MVISDYGRAKSLFAETDIKIFKRGVVIVYNVAIVYIIMDQHVLYKFMFFCC